MPHDMEELLHDMMLLSIDFCFSSPLKEDSDDLEMG